VSLVTIDGELWKRGFNPILKHVLCCIEKNICSSSQIQTTNIGSKSSEKINEDM